MSKLKLSLRIHHRQTWQSPCNNQYRRVAASSIAWGWLHRRRPTKGLALPLAAGVIARPKAAATSARSFRAPPRNLLKSHCEEFPYSCFCKKSQRGDESISIRYPLNAKFFLLPLDFLLFVLPAKRCPFSLAVSAKTSIITLAPHEIISSRHLVRGTEPPQSDLQRQTRQVPLTFHDQVLSLWFSAEALLLSLSYASCSLLFPAISKICFTMLSTSAFVSDAAM